MSSDEDDISTDEESGKFSSSKSSKSVAELVTSSSKSSSYQTSSSSSSSTSTEESSTLNEVDSQSLLTMHQSLEGFNSDTQLWRPFWSNLSNRFNNMTSKKQISDHKIFLENNIDEIIMNINNNLPLINNNLDVVVQQEKYWKISAPINQKLLTLHETLELFKTCDYKTISNDNKNSYIIKLQNILKFIITLKEFSKDMMFKKNVFGKMRNNISHLSDEEILSICHLKEEKLILLIQDLSDMIDSTINLSMAHRLGFNEFILKKRMKKSDSYTLKYRQIYYGIHEEKDVTVVALKSWDIKEAIQLYSITNQYNNGNNSLIPFYGYAIHEKIYYLVFDKAPMYSLYDYFSSNSNSKNKLWHLSFIFELLRQVLEGLAYLHKNNLRHGILSSRRIMVYSLPNDIYDNDYNNDDNIDNLRIKLYSTHYPSINDNKVMNDPKDKFYWRYKSPEAMQNNEEYLYSDIYAFGIVAWEMFSNDLLPWINCNTDDNICDLISCGHYLEENQKCPESIYNSLMIKSWTLSPQHRPSVSSLMIRIDELNHLLVNN